MFRRILTVALVAATLMPATAQAHPLPYGVDGSGPQLIRAKLISREDIKADRRQHRLHRERVHARLTFARKVRTVGTVNTGTFIGAIPGWYDPTLVKYHSLVLAQPAMDAYYDACQRVGHFIGGAGFRSHAEQQALAASKPGMAAPAGTSLHELGLAFDVFGVSSEEHAALMAAGFKQVRADEPWHYSWRVAG